MSKGSVGKETGDIQHENYLCVIINVPRHRIELQMQSDCGGEWNKNNQWENNGKVIFDPTALIDNKEKLEIKDKKQATIFDSLNEIKKRYKIKGYTLLFSKEHKYKTTNNLLLIFDNNKINHFHRIICKRILVVCAINKGKYIIKSSNSSIIGCRNNHCAPDDSFLDIQQSKEYITILNQYCGSDGRNVEYITFKYSQKKRDYLLHKYGTVLYHREDPEIQTDSKVLTIKDFGEIRIRNYLTENLFK